MSFDNRKEKMSASENKYEGMQREIDVIYDDYRNTEDKSTFYDMVLSLLFLIANAVIDIAQNTSNVKNRLDAQLSDCSDIYIDCIDNADKCFVWCEKMLDWESITHLDAKLLVKQSRSISITDCADDNVYLTCEKL